jgi:hypothetical protein
MARRALSELELSGGKRLVTASRSELAASKLHLVDTAVRAGHGGQIQIVRAIRACKHVGRMDVEIPGGSI